VNLSTFRGKANRPFHGTKGTIGQHSGKFSGFYANLGEFRFQKKTNIWVQRTRKINSLIVFCFVLVFFWCENLSVDCCIHSLLSCSKTGKREVINCYKTQRRLCFRPKANEWWCEWCHRRPKLKKRDKRHERDSSVSAYKVVLCYNGLNYKGLYGTGGALLYLA